MRKFSLILVALFLTTTLFAQRGYKSGGTFKFNWFNQGWFFDGNIGIRTLGKTSDIAKVNAGVTLNGGIGYMFNEKFGLKGRADYHNFKTTGGMSSTSHSVGLSIEGIASLVQIIGGRKARQFSLNLHGGLGLTSLFNPEYIRYVKDDLGREFNDPFIKGSDDIFHLIVGITPQYNINSKISIQLDISNFIQFKQHRTYDTFNAVRADGVTGVLGFSLGMTYRLK